EVEPPIREMIEHADLFDQPERIVERQAVHARPQPDAPRSLGGGREEDAGNRRQAERRGVVLGQMIGGEPRGVVLLEELKTALVEFVERNVPVVEMVEDPEIHRSSNPRLPEPVRKGTSFGGLCYVLAGETRDER